MKLTFWKPERVHRIAVGDRIALRRWHHSGEQLRIASIDMSWERDATGSPSTAIPSTTFASHTNRAGGPRGRSGRARKPVAHHSRSGRSSNRDPTKKGTSDMGWVRRNPPPHRCGPPHSSFFAEGNPGDLWRCDDCGALWRIYKGGLGFRTWEPAPFWLKIRYRRTRGEKRGQAA